MKLRRWFGVLLVSGIVALLVVSGFNYVVDPFGVFGDKFINWHSYNFENNPRIAKIGYLDNNYEKYNGYVIGGSKSSSINPELLNKYYGGESFYSMLMYGGDFFDYEKTLHYLVENYDVEHIVIHMSMHEMSHYNEEKTVMNNELHAKVLGEGTIPFYMKYLTLNFGYGKDKLEGLLKRRYDPTEASVFIPETGVYDKSVRDAEDLGTMDEFIEKYPEFNQDLPKMDSSGAPENLAALARMKEYCDSRDISFRFIVAPTYYKEMERYEAEGVEEFLKEATEITDYWNFSGYNTISYDPRYFYDSMHYRNNVGEMMLARIFNDDRVKVPEDFGEER